MKSTYEIQAENFARKWDVELIVYGDGQFKRNELWDDEKERCCFRCKIKRGEESYRFDFWQSIAEGANKPTIYDLLACLMKSDVGTYEEFCEEFGYDSYEDADKAVNIWRACKREWENVWKLFGGDEECWKEFCEIN